MFLQLVVTDALKQIPSDTMRWIAAAGHSGGMDLLRVTYRVFICWVHPPYLVRSVQFSFSALKQPSGESLNEQCQCA